MVMAKVWELVEGYQKIDPKAKDKHLLWALHYLKKYPSLRPMCATLKMPDVHKKRF